MGQHTSKSGGTRTAEYYHREFGKQLRELRDQGKLPAYLFGVAFPERHEGSYKAFNETYSITPALAEFKKQTHTEMWPENGVLTIGGYADTVRASIGNGTPEEIEVAEKQALFAMYKKHRGAEALAKEIRKMK